MCIFLYFSFYLLLSNYDMMLLDDWFCLTKFWILFSFIYRDNVIVGTTFERNFNLGIPTLRVSI